MMANIDWSNTFSTLIATLIGGWAGGWFASRATMRQIESNVGLEREMWLRERAFELLQLIDEFVGISFRKGNDVRPIQERDILSKKLLTLSSVLLSREDGKNIESRIWKVRAMHVEGGKCSFNFGELDEFFKSIKDKLQNQFLVCEKNK